MLRVGMMTENIQRYKDLKGALKTIKDIGFECADISFMTPGNNSIFSKYFDCDNYKEKAHEIKEYAKSIGLPIVQAHAPFPVYSETDPEYNKKMFNTLVKCIEISGIIGLKHLIIHPWNYFSDDQNVEFFNKLIPFAKENDVIICTENMWGWDTSIDKAKPCACSLPESFNNTIDKVNSPYLKACVDIGHCEMFSYMGLSARKMLEEMNDRVYCLHIHDNDRKHDYHKIPFTMDIDYDDVVKGLKNINYNNDLITETILDKPYKYFFQAKRYWKKQFKAALKLKEMLQEK